MVMSNIILVVVRLSVLVGMASCPHQDILQVESPAGSYVIQKIPLDASRGFLLHDADLGHRSFTFSWIPRNGGKQIWTSIYCSKLSWRHFDKPIMVCYELFAMLNLCRTLSVPLNRCELRLNRKRYHWCHYCFLRNTKNAKTIWPALNSFAHKRVLAGMGVI